MDYILQTNRLTKKYKNFQALNGLTMNVPKGAIYGFVGKNGAGKTTLIRLICGLQEPTSGDFTLYSIRNDSKEIIKARRRMSQTYDVTLIHLMADLDDIEKEPIIYNTLTKQVYENDHWIDRELDLKGKLLIYTKTEERKAL